MASDRKSCTHRKIENISPGSKGQKSMGRKMLGAGQGQPDLECVAELRKETPTGRRQRQGKSWARVKSEGYSGRKHAEN